MKTLLFFIICIFIIGAFFDLSAEPKKGGELKIALTQYPRSLNNYTGGDAYGASIASLVMESMLNVRDEDYENIGALAEKWEMKKDKLTYMFYINKNARFFDNKPVTAHDVKFTIDMIYDPKCILCQSHRDYMGPIEKVRVIDDYTIEVKMKNIHFANLEKIGGMPILAKHIYGAKGKDFNKDFDKVIYGSGPYIYKPSKSRKSLSLVKNKNWWGHKNNNLPYAKDYFNFDKITIKIIKDYNVAFEVFKKKKIDLLYMNSQLFSKWDRIKIYPWADKKCVRITTKKNYPFQWRGIALNMRKGATADKKFRKALQHLLNRSLLNKKVFKNKKRSIGGPFMPGSPYSANLKPIPYSPEIATKFLKELGYTKADNKGVLYREKVIGGKKIQERASIVLMHAWEEHNKWATIFKEDCRKVGIEINIKLVEWTAATKLMDEFKFDAFVIGWSGGVIPAPEQLFSGKTANVKGTSNYPGLNNLKINKLIKDGPAEFNKTKRYAIYQKLERLIVDEQPYIFFVTDKDHLLAYWSHKIYPTETPFLKYTGDDLRNQFYNRWYKKTK